MSASGPLEIFKQAASEWMEDDAPTLGAALAYYTVFSMAPLLIISIAIAGMVLGQEAAQGQIFQQLHGLIGDQGSQAVEEMVHGASAQPKAGVAATVIGAITLLFGASGVFGQLQASLNRIWGVEPKPGRGIMGIIKDRALSFGFILAVGFLLLVSLLLSAAIAYVGTWLSGMFPSVKAVGPVLDTIVSLAAITFLFALMFKFLPDAKIAWHDVWVGAFLTATLFTVGKALLGIYLGKGGVTSSFGAAGSLIVLLLWVYYSSQILFFGAEFTQVYANALGSHLTPKENATIAQHPGR